MRKICLIIAIFCTTALGAVLKQKITINNFNAGQLSPLMNSRVDMSEYRRGAKTLQNMLVRVQGPITRRPGTKYISDVKDANDSTRLIPFEYSTESAFILELGDYYARFFKNGAVVADPNGATHFEVDTPWAESDVFEVQYAQDGAVMRLVHPDYAPYKIEHPNDTNDASWSCTEISFDRGPFLDENTDSSITITPSGTTGSITLTASSSIFDSDDVGSLWMIKQYDEAESISGQCYYQDFNSTSIEIAYERYYTASVLHTMSWLRGTLTLQKSYDSGTSWRDVYEFPLSGSDVESYTNYEDFDDADYRIHGGDSFLYSAFPVSQRMRYQIIAHAFTRQGVVEITAYTSGTEVSATVVKTLASTDATWQWAQWAWGGDNGYPRTVEYYEQRVVYGGSDAYPQTLWASIIAEDDDDYDTFYAGTSSSVTETNAWTYTLPGKNPIQWLKAGGYLFVGTTGGVIKVGSESEAITPLNSPVIRIQNYNGCDYLQPELANNAMLYVERGGQKIRELQYTYTTEQYVAPDMTVLSENITGDGINQIAFQQRPDPILWCVRQDGTLLSFTYHRDNDVLAWGEHTTGSSDDFKSVTRIPGTASEDELWAVTSRTIDSNTVGYVEQFQPIDWERVSSVADQNDCWFVDAGDTDPNSLSHLEGESVLLYADGRPVGSYAVSSGAISPGSSYTNYTIGKGYTSAYETMPIIAYDNTGPVHAARTTINSMNVNFYKTLGCSIGPDSSNLTDFKFSSDSWATTIDTFTGYKDSPYLWGTKQAPTVYFAEDGSVPMTLREVNVWLEAVYDQ